MKKDKYLNCLDNAIVVKKGKGKRTKENRLVGRGNWITDFFNYLVNAFGQAFVALGNFVNDNEDLFTSILCDLVCCLVFPEFTILDFAGTIASVATTIVKYTADKPPEGKVSQKDAIFGLTELMADDRWKTEFSDPLSTYLKYIKDFVTGTRPVNCKSCNTGMYFDIQGTIAAVDFTVGGVKKTGIVIKDLITDQQLTYPIIIDCDFSPTYQLKIWVYYNGVEWRKGQSQQAAINTLYADYRNWFFQPPHTNTIFSPDSPQFKYDKFVKASWNYPPPAPFQQYNPASIYAIMDSWIENQVVPDKNVPIPTTKPSAFAVYLATQLGFTITDNSVTS
jgi:hypothetical protein